MLVTGRDGNLRGEGREGFYYRDERYLSGFVISFKGLHIGEVRTISEPFSLKYLYELSDGTRIRRVQRIGKATFTDEVKLLTNKPLPMEVKITPSFEDVFEVRGFLKPPPLPKLIKVRELRGGLEISCRCRDGILRRVMISFPQSFKVKGLKLEGTCKDGLTFVVRAGVSAKEGHGSLSISLAKWLNLIPSVKSGDAFLNALFVRSAIDIFKLLLDPDGCLMVNAGAPDYLNPFGRDSLIVGFQLLPFVPEVAKYVLKFLARYQGRKVNKRNEEEPGKIMHELRFGELTSAGIAPFNPYYGSVDSTPLFLWLYSEYLKWTADLKLAKELYPNALEALNWIMSYGDADGDYLVEYVPGLLINKGWKDSPNSIFHSDGSDLTPPIALVEVQGYVYSALKSFNEVVEYFGLRRPDVDLDYLVRELGKLIKRKFWSAKLSYYGIALDGDKKLAEVISSNPGHLLWAKAISLEDARRVAKVILDEELLWTGFGVKTLAWGELRHDEYSYHNGSVWLHDNAIIALGLSSYGLKGEASTISDGLLSVIKSLGVLSLPEYLSGNRLSKGTPTPLGCTPQAWSAGSLFMLLTSWLNPTVSLEGGELTLDPWLPKVVRGLTRIRRFKFRGKLLNIVIKGVGVDTEINLL